MNCERLLEKCGAECCGPCPFPRGLWERNMHRIVRPPLIARLDDQGHVHAVSAEGPACSTGPAITAATSTPIAPRSAGAMGMRRTCSSRVRGRRRMGERGAGENGDGSIANSGNGRGSF